MKLFYLIIHFKNLIFIIFIFQFNEFKNDNNFSLFLTPS